MAGSAVEEIKARLDVAEVIGAQVPLKRAGRTLKGLCPFHGEKTPSFVVWPESGNWKCFGCGESGDVFTWVEKREGLEFSEALRTLAARAGVELPEWASRPQEELAAEEQLRAVLAAASLYFRAAFDGSVGAAARAYLERRGVTAESINRFGIGYAPAGGLLRHLQDQGFTLDLARDAGLASQREDGSRYEMFRERVTFPIRDPEGRTIGFGGRTLGEGQPKYLNGPQTPLFDKGASLFGLDLARPAIRSTGRAVIVEGYLDAIIAHQYGFQNVVATLGTALTPRHLDLLGRRAGEIILALDADTAGQAATLRGLDVALQAPADAVVPVPVPGLRGLIRYQTVRKSQVKVVTLPSGMDPDELIRTDPAEWERLVRHAMAVVDFVLSRLGDRHDLNAIRGKQEAVEEAMGVIRDLTDPVEREHYLQRLATLVGIDEGALRGFLSRAQRRRAQQDPGPAVSDQPDLPEAYPLALLWMCDPPSSFAVDAIPTPEGRAIFGLYLQASDLPRDRQGLSALLDRADPALQPALEKVAERLPGIEPLTQEQRRRELEVASLRLRQRKLGGELELVRSMLEETEPGDSSEQASALPLLSSIATQLREVEAALKALDVVSSVVWRSRRFGEVLGG